MKATLELCNFSVCSKIKLISIISIETEFSTATYASRQPNKDSTVVAVVSFVVATNGNGGVNERRSLFVSRYDSIASHTSQCHNWLAG